MKTKLLSLSLCLCLALSLVIPAYAVDDETNVANIEDIQPCVEASAELTCTAEDGTLVTVPVDVEMTTTEIFVPHMLYANGDDTKYYATTATANVKSKPGIKSQYGVSASMTIYWIDHFGVNNEFAGLTGNWAPLSGSSPTLSDRFVSMKGQGVQASSEGPVKKIYPAKNSFEIPASSYTSKWLSFRAHSKVLVNSSDTLVLDVAT